jgi:hypothetical protein
MTTKYTKWSQNIPNAVKIPNGYKNAYLWYANLPETAMLEKGVFQLRHV